MDHALVGLDGLYELLFCQLFTMCMSPGGQKHYRLKIKNPVVETTGLKPKPSAIMKKVLEF